MCRVLLYLGSQSISLYDLIIAPDNSLVKQAYAPAQMGSYLNLAGFGVAAWSKIEGEWEFPYLYKTTKLPFYDANLKRLSKKLTVKCALAHVRGVTFEDSEIVNEEGVHPFILEGSQLVFAHNGGLAMLGEMKRELTPKIKQEYYSQIRGQGDSEWIYALFLSQLENPFEYVSLNEVEEALFKTLFAMKKIRKKLHIHKQSSMNLFLTNGEYVVVTRFVYDYGWGDKSSIYPTLWYTFGEEYGIFEGVYSISQCKKRYNIIFASEPLTKDLTTWVEAPEYSMTSAIHVDGEVSIHTHDIAL